MVLNKKTLPIKDFKLAAVHGVVWVLLLLTTRHPAEEWAVVLSAMYIALWLSREIVVNLMELVGDRLTEYGRRTLKKAGVELPDEPPAEYRSIVTLLAVSVGLLMIATIVGASLSVGIPAMRFLGLTPLASYLNWIGWMLLGIGMIGLSSLFAAVWSVYVKLNTLIDSPIEKAGTGIIGFYAIKEKPTSFGGVAPVGAAR